MIILSGGWRWVTLTSCYTLILISEIIHMKTLPPLCHPHPQTVLFNHEHYEQCWSSSSLTFSKVAYFLLPVFHLYFNKYHCSVKFDVYPAFYLWWTALDWGRALSIISYFYLILVHIILSQTFAAVNKKHLQYGKSVRAWVVSSVLYKV